MHSLTNIKCTCIITLLKSGLSTRDIAKQTNVSIASISCICTLYCSDTLKSSGGRSAKLNAANISYANYIICIHKTDNAVQVTKALQNVINQPLSS